MRKALSSGALASAFAITLFTGSAASTQAAEKYKMTTQIPPGIEVPDKVETRLGALHFEGGCPDTATVEKLYDNLDFQRAVQAYLLVNDDGSVDVYFGPKPPPGKEPNWVRTIPGESWFTILRLYGPLEPWFNQTWLPGEIELVI